MPQQTTDPRRDARMALAALCEPGNAELNAMLASDDPTEVLARLTHPATDTRLARTVRQRLAGRDSETLIDRLRERTVECGARVLIPGDAEWPESVNELDNVHDEAEPDNHAPVCLWLRGDRDLAAACDTSVGIVGARACSPYGRHVATELGYQLAVAGWSVVSGGAYGIDAAAHRGCLAADGTTVAVMACGVDRPYPTCNAGLFDTIVAQGLLISEWPVGDVPQRHRFLVRNRVIAAMTRGTVVVEAALRSGARHTARRARELDRPVMIVPGPVTSALSQGAHQLAREPGEARLVSCADDIIADLGRIGEGLTGGSAGPPRPHDALPPSAARVLDALPSRGGAEVERLAAQAGLPREDTQRVLELLTRHGFACRDETGYRAVPAPHAPSRRP